MLKILKEKVCEANLELVKLGLVLFTWGNVSAIDRESGFIVIKPSGVPYDTMTADDMVVVDLSGKVAEGRYRPSSDTPTHIELYKAFDTGAVVHTHSKWATIWSQAGKPVPALGTTHADSFYGSIPVTRPMTGQEINGEYEKETGKVIIELFNNTDARNIPGVLVNNHGPFTWGDTPGKAVENSAVLEYICEMAYYTLEVNKQAEMPKSLLDKHFLRKHGKDAYYGQK
jgi:L-ribulose-5-phosphate 4-epimerase